MILKYNFEYTGAVQSWVVPYTGIYNLEVWGAQGGDMLVSPWTGKGGKGGYACGRTKLTKGQTIYLYVGGQGQGYYGDVNHPGGWNGGGTSNAGASGGGGATDIRTNFDNLYSRIIVAGGGGGSNDHVNGGAGGGLTGGTGQATDGTPGNGGTQTSGGTGWINGSFGIGGGAANAYPDGGAGGAGWYGGGKAHGYNSSGGGGSSYIGTLDAASTISGINSGSGKAVISYRRRNRIVLYKDGKYYIPNKSTFNIHTKSFRDVTINEIISMISNYNYTYDISTLDSSFTFNGEKFYPKDIINFSEYKLCVVTDDKPIKLNINYTPSRKALSNTTIKIKNKYTPITENLYNSYLDMIATDKSKISYSIDYVNNTHFINKSCSLIDTEVMKNDFYISFNLNDPTSFLKSVILYKNDNVSYTKIKDNDLKIDNNYENTFITLKKTYNKVLINRITKLFFDYLNNNLDKF